MRVWQSSGTLTPGIDRLCSLLQSRISIGQSGPGFGVKVLEFKLIHILLCRIYWIGWVRLVLGLELRF